ncbi:putative membrane protein [Moraxella catarrhalis]|nr:putative membrane protein [Moraxella catarrhalis]AZQ91501.1 putative membrane protein [Moraxella catarrhalis]EKF83877.1 hypothetical protein MCRH_0390 [Moraxella catarrhalis RH4]
MGQSNDINQAAKFWLLYADDCGGIGCVIAYVLFNKERYP